MTWIKLDDKAPRHPKVASLTNLAFRWWVKGLCYASEFLTNGVLPPVFWKEVPKQSRAEISGNRLWDWDDPNFIIHDYQHYQSLKEDVEYEKNRNRTKAANYRAKKRAEKVTGDVTGNASPLSDPLVPNPENREQRTDTENREQTTATPSPLRPLVSGESNPKTWGRIHGDHVTGFCDWVCLPEFVFAEFVRKSAGADYVRQWATGIRAKFEGQTVGDNLKFWRVRWSEAHPEVATKPQLEPFSVAKALEIEAQRKAERMAKGATR